MIWFKLIILLFVLGDAVYDLLCEKDYLFVKDRLSIMKWIELQQKKLDRMADVVNDPGRTDKFVFTNGILTFCIKYGWVVILALAIML